MVTIIDEIREHLQKYLPNAVFSYGRSFDTSLAAAKIEVSGWFIHLDPIEFNGKANDSVQTARLSMGFLRKDRPDSAFDKAENLEIDDSIEEIQATAATEAINWLNDFLENYDYSDGDYNLRPLTRVKNVMSGTLLTVTLSGKIKC